MANPYLDDVTRTEPRLLGLLVVGLAALVIAAGVLGVAGVDLSPQLLDPGAVDLGSMGLDDSIDIDSRPAAADSCCT